MTWPLLMLTRKSIDQLAMELIILRTDRPEERRSDAYRDHMHEEYLLEQEIYRRIGHEIGNERLKRAREVLDMVIP